MAQRKYTKLTDSQQYAKYMREYDAWVQKEMIDHEAEILAYMDKIAEARREQT